MTCDWWIVHPDEYKKQARYRDGFFRRLDKNAPELYTNIRVMLRRYEKCIEKRLDR